MRLEQHVNAPEPAQAWAIESGADFGGVVSVIVHDGDAALVAAHLEAAIDSAEGREALADGVGLDIEFHGNGDGGHGIEHVVEAGDTQGETADTGGAIADIELAEKRAADDIGGLDIGLRGGAVGDGAAADFGEQALHVGVVEADDGGAVDRHLVDELDEGGADGVERRVVIQMLAIHVGDDGDDGRELEEAAVALIGFDDQEIATAHAGVGAAHGADASADHYGGVQTGEIEDGGGQGSGGGLAVAAGHRDAVLEAHELGEEFAARDDGDLEAAGLLHFRVLFLDGGADDEGARAGDVGGGVAFEDTRAHGGEALGDGRQLQVAARDLVAQVEEHFRDAAHADASNSGEMKVLGSKEHFLIVLFRLIEQLSIENMVSTAFVGQIVNLRPIVNRPGGSKRGRRISNPPQVSNLPHKPAVLPNPKTLKHCVAVKPVRPPLKRPRRAGRRRVWRIGGQLRPWDPGPRSFG